MRKRKSFWLKGYRQVLTYDFVAGIYGMVAYKRIYRVKK